MSAVLMLTACGMSKQESSQLLPPAVVAEGKLRAQAEAAAAKSLHSLPLETGSVSSASAVPPLNGAKAPVVSSAAKTTGGNAAAEELYIDFLPGSVTLSDREKASIKEAVAVRLLSGEVRLRISAARGGTGNQFDQAIIADKRARIVNGILPIRMVESVEFDPNLPEETVRIEFYRPVKRLN
ncbi:MAG: hypothetical protein ABL901_20650 [Hyphomicrobiaceae bacterium]